MRPLDGPLAEVRGEKPEEAVHEGPAAHLQEVWVAVRAALRDVLETVTLADIVSGDLPPGVRDLLDRCRVETLFRQQGARHVQQLLAALAAGHPHPDDRPIPRSQSGYLTYR